MSTNNEVITTTLTELNGQEVKDIAKKRVNDAVDKLPYLRQALTFHEAIISFAIKITCLNKEIPVPDPMELVFEIVNPNADSEEVKKSKEFLELVLNNKEKAEEFVKKCELLLNQIAPEGEIIDTYPTGNTPDSVRIEHDLPIPVESTSQSGVRSEEYIKASEHGFRVAK